MEHKIFDNSGNSIKEGPLKTYSYIFENFSQNFYRSFQFQTGILEFLVEWKTPKGI